MLKYIWGRESSYVLLLYVIHIYSLLLFRNQFFLPKFQAMQSKLDQKKR